MEITTVGELIDFLAANFNRDYAIVKSDLHNPGYVPITLAGNMLYRVRTVDEPIDTDFIDTPETDDRGFPAVVL